MLSQCKERGCAGLYAEICLEKGNNCIAPGISLFVTLKTIFKGVFRLVRGLVTGWLLQGWVR